MKSRDIFLPSLSGVLVVGLIVFQSCAHQNRSAEQADAMDEATYSEADTGSNPESTEQASATGDLGETSADPQNSLAGPIAENTETKSQGDSIESLEKELESGSLDSASSKDPLANSSQKSSAAADSSLESELESDSTTPPSTSNAAPNLGEEAASAGAVAGATASNSDLESELESVEPVQPKTDELEAKQTVTPELEPLPKETLKSKPTPRYSAPRASSKVPKIPAKAVTRKGTKLNRFYFVRQGDSPKSVSSLIYGSSKKANLLTKWNGKGWAPGQIIYYASPVSPKDSRMDSFYKENGLLAEEYEVARGEWLSKIAQKKLGSPKSWTEIAVVNGIKSPKTLEVGQKIAIYPKDLTARPQETMIAKNEPVAQPVVEAAPIKAPPVVEPPPVVEAPPVQAEAPVAAVESKKEPVTSAPVQFDANKFVEQNMFAALMGIAGILLLALLVVKKRRKAREASAADDFDSGDEGFQPPTKLKRK